MTNPAKTVIVRHDLSNARTFYLERVIKVEPPPPGPMSAMDIVKYDHPYQQQQFQLQKEQQDIEVQQKMAGETNSTMPPQVHDLLCGSLYQRS